MAKKFNYSQAEKLAKVFNKYNVRYMFIGKSGAIILGYPDTTEPGLPEKRREKHKT